MQPASGCYQYFLETAKHALCLSTNSTYFPIAGHHISAGVRKIFNHKTAPVERGGVGAGFDEAHLPKPYTQTQAVVIKPNTPTAVLRMARGLHQRAQRSHEETTLSKIIESLGELCQQRRGKSQKKVTLDGNEILSIIQDLVLEYKDHETPEKTVCSTASSRKFHGTLCVVCTPRRCDPRY